MWLPVVHFGVIPQHDVVKQVEEGLVSAGLHVKRCAAGAGGHGQGHAVPAQMANQSLHPWGGGRKAVREVGGTGARRRPAGPWASSATSSPRRLFSGGSSRDTDWTGRVLRGPGHTSSKQNSSTVQGFPIAFPRVTQAILAETNSASAFVETWKAGGVSPGRCPCLAAQVPFPLLSFREE